MTKIIFVEPDGKEVTVDAQNGLSLLEVAHNNGISLEGACEGSLACSTCHIIVEEGFTSLEDASDDEEDLLDKAWGLEARSRLGCQVYPKDELTIIKIPKYTINQVSEDH